MWRLSLALVLLLSLFCHANAGPSIFIIRHAEKTDASSKDPSLSEAGRARAESIARMLRDAKIGAIYEGTSNMQLQTIAKGMLK